MSTRGMQLGTATATPGNVFHRMSRIASVVPITGVWLDNGCADGGYTDALMQRGAERVYGSDIDPKRIEAARRRWSQSPELQFEAAAAEALPFPDATFDGVLMNEVLEHVQDQSLAIGEARRVLRPGGYLVVLVPNRLFPFEGHGLRLGTKSVGIPVPLLPWLPSRLTNHFMWARNYWPWEIRSLISSEFEVVAESSVFPVFEVYKWVPSGILSWYRTNLRRIERAPVLKRFGVSTLIAAQKRADRSYLGR